jgi:hypothetical protein
MEPSQAFEHKGRVLRLSAYEAEPSGSATPRPPFAPGAGRFEIGQIGLAQGSGGLTLTTQVHGRNIAYIYVEALLKDKSLDRFYGPVAREHVQTDRNKETRGIARPDWGDPVEIAAGLHLGLRLLTDGVDSAFCFSFPEGYGSPEHRLDGLYALAGGTAPFRARLFFDSTGETKRVLAHREHGRSSLPHALTPKHGDQFTPFVQVIAPPTGDGDWDVTLALSTPLVFQDQRLRVVTETPIPGDYLVGLVVQDLDGGLSRKYVPLTVGA